MAYYSYQPNGPYYGPPANTLESNFRSNQSHDVGCLWETGPEQEYMEFDGPEGPCDDIYEPDSGYERYYVQDPLQGTQYMYQWPRKMMADQQILLWEKFHRNQGYQGQNEFGNHPKMYQYLQRKEIFIMDQ